MTEPRIPDALAERIFNIDDVRKHAAEAHEGAKKAAADARRFLDDAERELHEAIANARKGQKELFDEAGGQ